MQAVRSCCRIIVDTEGSNRGYKRGGVGSGSRSGTVTMNGGLVSAETSPLGTGSRACRGLVSHQKATYTGFVT